MQSTDNREIREFREFKEIREFREFKEFREFREFRDCSLSSLSSLSSLIFLNFEATGERVPFVRLKERTEDEDERERIELMRAMREEGMSYRQIAEELGYKSHTTVVEALKKID